MKCQYCNKESEHPVTACPSVRSVEFDSDGNIVKVEKFAQSGPATFSYGNTTSTPWRVTYTYWQGDEDGKNKEEPH